MKLQTVMKIRVLLAFMGILAASAYAMQPQQPAQLKVGGSTADWYRRAAITRGITNAVQINVANKSSGPIFALGQGTNNDYSWSTIDSGYTREEDLFSMDRLMLNANARAPQEGEELVKRPFFAIRTANNQLYVLNFEKSATFSATNPLFTALLEKVKDPSITKELQEPGSRPYVTEFMKRFVNKVENDGLEKEQVASLERVAPGAIVKIIINDENGRLARVTESDK